MKHLIPRITPNSRSSKDQALPNCCFGVANLYDPDQAFQPAARVHDDDDNLALRRTDAEFLVLCDRLDVWLVLTAAGHMECFKSSHAASCGGVGLAAKDRYRGSPRGDMHDLQL